MAKKVLMLIVVHLVAASMAWPHTMLVSRVEAGDVIVLRGNWKTRLTGIVVSGPRDPIGFRAYDFTKRRLEGKIVRVFTFTTDNTAAGIVRDAEGLPRATILFGKGVATDIAELLLAEGFARVDESMLPEDCWHYREIEAEARSRGVGVWASVQ